MSKPRVSVIILSYNRKRHLIDAIESIRAQTYKNYEIIVVDNNSTDGSPDEIERKFPEVRLIRMPYNTGIPGGRNIGIVNSKGDILFFLDDDGILEKDGLKKLVDIFDITPEIGIISCKVVNYFSGAIDHWPHPKPQSKYHDKEFLSTYFNGGAAAIRREVFQQTGLFLSEFFYSAEEIELSLRLLKKTSYKILYSPSIIMKHKVRVEKKAGRNTLFYSLRNRLCLIWMFFPLSMALEASFVRLISEFAKAIKNNWIFSYFAAIFAFFKRIPFVIEKRDKLKGRALQEYKRLHEKKDTFEWLYRKLFKR